MTVLDTHLQALDQLGWAWHKRGPLSWISGGNDSQTKVRSGIISTLYRDMRTVKQQQQKNCRLHRHVRVQDTYWILRELHTRLCLQGNIYDKREIVDLIMNSANRIRNANLHYSNHGT